MSDEGSTVATNSILVKRSNKWTFELDFTGKYSPGVVFMTTIDDKINELLNKNNSIFEELTPRWKLAFRRDITRRDLKKAFCHICIITNLLRSGIYLGWYLL
jgi:hypothetical protein